ncbi:MAG: hypothetical protein C0501_07930 [Isosphaera sp.]|nr:hypothetical protein [Isosphaera sp.]
MAELALTFEQEPGQTTPRLRPRAGSAVPWAEGELRELEADLIRRYPDMIKGKVETVAFRDRVLRVTVRADGRTRMPGVVLTDAAAPAPTPAAGPGWLDGLLQDVDRLRAEAGSPGLDPRERTALGCAVDELRGLAGQVGPGCVAGVLLAGYLTQAEHTVKAADPDGAAVYAVALRGLEKVLARLGADDGRIPGRAGRGAADAAAPRGAVSRLLRRLLGLSGGANGSGA